MTFDREFIRSKAEEYFEIAPDERYQEEERRQLERLPKAFDEGYWEWDDLEWIVRWKTARSIGYFRRNDADRVERVLDYVKDTESTEFKIDLLRMLSGVGVPMASSFLLFMDPDEYSVIDSRAIEALSSHGYLESGFPQSPSTEDYVRYLEVCHNLSEELNVDLRTLDRALWVLGGSE